MGGDRSRQRVEIQKVGGEIQDDERRTDRNKSTRPATTKQSRWAEIPEVGRCGRFLSSGRDAETGNGDGGRRQGGDGAGQSGQDAETGD
jgi:hypothetical protein